jgi:hypothetical protein
VPWRGPEVEGEFPTLGYLVGDWIEANCVIPDGIYQGEPFKLTDEMWRFLFRFYRLRTSARRNPERPSAAFANRGGLLMRPQKWGKGPFAAAICLAEAFGPVRFDGWDERGEPKGVAAPTPWIQIVATSEEQTDNTWLALYEMARRGRVADISGVDIGVEDINLPSGGKIEPRTSSGKARLGARLTFAVFDETHLFVESNGGVLLASTMKRNIGGMSGRWLETTNAYDPSQRSVAQRTHEHKAPDVVIDYRPGPRLPDQDDDEDCLSCLEHVYGDSWWVDLDRILTDARDPGVCPTWPDALRYFFNRIVVGVSDAVDATRWDALKRPRDLRSGDKIAIGFDGSRSQDCTSLVASRIADGRWFHLKTWDPADYLDHKVPRVEVDRVLTDAFNAYEVWYFFGDPYRWQEYFDVWSARWPKRVVEFPTNVEKRMDEAIVRFQTVLARELTHDGDETLRTHAMQAAIARGRKRAPRPEEDPSVAHHFLRVIPKRDKGHIDALVAGLLAEAARGQAIEDGALNATVPLSPSFLPHDSTPSQLETLDLMHVGF